MKGDKAVSKGGDKLKRKEDNLTLLSEAFIRTLEEECNNEYDTDLIRLYKKMMTSIRRFHSYRRYMLRRW